MLTILFYELVLRPWKELTFNIMYLVLDVSITCNASSLMNCHATVDILLQTVAVPSTQVKNMNKQVWNKHINRLCCSLTNTLLNGLYDKLINHCSHIQSLYVVLLEKEKLLSI